MRIEVDIDGKITKHKDAPVVARPIEEMEDERIALIKSKANELIVSKYSIIWQLNHPRLDETYINQYAWIDNVRNISNEAESTGIALEDINWGI